MNRLDELEAKLAAEVAALKISNSVEAALLSEFEARRCKPRRVLWLLPVAASLAAATFWLMPHPTPASTRLASATPPQLPPAAITPTNPDQPKPARRHTTHQPKPVTSEPQFVRIPFSAPLGPYDRAEIIRAEIPVSALTAAGFQIATTDTSATAQADLLVGRDGMAHAIRLISLSTN